MFNIVSKEKVEKNLNNKSKLNVKILITCPMTGCDVMRLVGLIVG